jgi:hypothetical protein
VIRSIRHKGLKRFYEDDDMVPRNAALFIFRSDAAESRTDLISDYSARRATYVGAKPTGERGLVNSSGGKA